MKIFNLSGKFLFDINRRFSYEGDKKFKIEDVDLESKDFQDLDFENVLFVGGNFDNANACGVKILKTSFEGAWLCDIDLSAANLEYVEFYDIEAYGAKFREAKISNAIFFGANLSRADFCGSMLRDVVFKEDNIGHKTDLSGADFTDVNLSSVTFEGALYDAKTRFPTGFNPSWHSGLERTVEDE